MSFFRERNTLVRQLCTFRNSQHDRHLHHYATLSVKQLLRYGTGEFNNNQCMSADDFGIWWGVK